MGLKVKYFEYLCSFLSKIHLISFSSVNYRSNLISIYINRSFIYCFSCQNPFCSVAKFISEFPFQVDFKIFSF